MTAIDRIRRRALGRRRGRGSRLVQMRTTVRESAIDASRILRDPGNRRHQRTAVRHRRVLRGVVAGGVLTGLVVGGAAAGISRVRTAPPGRGDGAGMHEAAPDGDSESRP